MKRTWQAVFCSLILCIFLFLQGCGDTNMFESMSDDTSEAARLEQIKQDLNSGNYDSVIAYLEAKPLIDLTDQEIRYLASAYVGKAGFDALTLIEKITEENEEGAEEDAELFGFIADIFDENADGEILRSEVTSEGDPNNPPGKIEYLDSAIEVLDPNFSCLPEDSLQRGVYAAVHAVLTISLAVSDQYDHSDPNDPILLTDEDLQSVCGDSVTLDDIIIQNRLDDLNRDLAIVQSALNSLGAGESEEDNEVGQDLEEFLMDIGYSEADPVSGDDLEVYLNEYIA